MNTKSLLWAAATVLVMFFSGRASAAVFYVDVNSTNPVPPYATWGTAAVAIQDAVNAATNGDLILVTNGIYNSEGATSPDGATNRVSVPLAIAIQSVNGPGATIINGGGLMRCIYLTNGASLAGMTLTNGFAGYGGGGVYCQFSASIIVSNCIIAGNEVGNEGGGAYGGTLIDCTLFQNTAYYSGGGAAQCGLLDCLIISNSCPNGSGGGLYNANATNCAICGNSTALNGGGGGYGGGAANGTLVNCTVTGNTASIGGGSYYANGVNCINYFNFAGVGTNFWGGSFGYSCTLPAASGTGDITNDPMLATAFLISTNSPCRARGTAAAALGLDINGNPWANPPSIGCNEPQPGTMTGLLNVAIVASSTNQPVGYSVYFQANISGQASYSQWNFGDGTTVTNEPYVSHTWSSVGDYPVVLTAYNDGNSTGETATVFVNVYQPTVFYVVATRWFGG